MASSRPLKPAPVSVENFFEFSILIMVTSGYLAMLGSGTLDLPSAVCAGLAILLRFLLLAGFVHYEIPPRWVSLATLAYILFYPVDYYLLSRDFLTATVHLVVFVAAVKILSARSTRDYIFVKVIALLEMLAAALLSTNPTFFVFLATFLLSTVAAFTSGEIRAASIRHSPQNRALPPGIGRRLGWLSGGVALSVLLLSAALFFVLPRTARAALERFLPPSSRVSGFSEEVSLGDSGAIRRNTAAVMHVQFDEKVTDADVKFRGSTLGEFDGMKWYNSERQSRPLHPENGLLKLADDEQRRRPGRRVTSQILLEVGSGLLFLPGYPEFLRVPSEVVFESAGGALRVPVETNGLRYIVHSYFTPGRRMVKGERQLSDNERAFYLRLPPMDRRIFQLANRWTEGYQLDRDRAAALEHHLRTSFTYGLEGDSPPASDQLSWFLFEKKRGHCEYFASAMAVMLRASWIPSRIVTGFQSGAYNDITGWHVVRHSDAHAWVEAWIPGEGWMVFDPTPPNPAAATMGLTDRVALYLDAASLFWQEWVIGYDLDRQLTLAFRVDQSRRRISFRRIEDYFAGLRNWVSAFASEPGKWHGQALLTVLMALVALAGALLLVRRKRSLLRRRLHSGQATMNDAILLYRQMLTALARRGLIKPEACTPLEFARMAGDVETARAVEQFTFAYNELRFGGKAEAAVRLPLLLERIERLPK